MTPERDTHTPRRTFRIPDDEWESLKRATEARGETITDVYRRAGRRYAAKYDPERTKS